MFKQSHFETIGALITDMRKRHPDSEALLDEVTDQFANYFKSDNPRFNAEAFDKVCGKTATTIIEDEFTNE